ncbi:SGNH/GDSL hydrolase family protein [Corynebacterium callunae]|uniref:SGNH/GDSL hydrolase family protein n=1 Tax=Corynebacterium callunae TaxID=1721 RepID=UPI002000084D|nr:SGNH/GDSL hydrolase family protein [Corynebacterium callunae]MCK2199377.1 SGNH/GDSL hydrolase family protein [Corynebacterium callunae]
MKRLVGTLLSVLVLSACSAEPARLTSPEGMVAPSEGASISASKYVALGDSYASTGSRFGALRDSFCRRSEGNYPQLVDPDVDDVSCQGAMIGDLFNTRDTDDETLPPQFDELNSDTKLVTLTIGANDIGFGDVTGCIRAEMEAGTADCRDQVSIDFSELGTNLDNAYAEIHQRAPQAQVISTGYVSLLAAGECPALTAVSAEDQQWALNLSNSLNQKIAEAAVRNGADYVLPSGAAEHTVCAPPAQRWGDFEGFDTDAYPEHMTQAGHEAVAAAVRVVIEL